VNYGQIENELTKERAQMESGDKFILEIEEMPDSNASSSEEEEAEG
jgi:hypothetical protein